ncbi:MAG: efflux RND transporter permease subunit, partial [Planctomycetota bacterium]
LNELRGMETEGGIATGEELLHVRDIGKVFRGYVEPRMAIMRYNGMPAIGIAVSNRPGVNIVDVGKAIEKRMHELEGMFPIGIEVHPISWQSTLVSESVRSFVVSLIQAVLIVLVVLWLFMGLGTAFVVGVCGLAMVIVATFLVMWLWGIDLQRMSLGALVVAMGMMVDNAIVVVDGIMVRIQRGMDRKQAAIEAAWQPAFPLLGATIIAVLAFYPIYASDEGAGEYCASLFQVVAISLLLSWVLSVTVTPLMAMWLLPEPKASEAKKDPFDTGFFRMFRSLLQHALRWRIPVLGGTIVLLVLAAVGFQGIDKTFFPESARLQFMIDYWAAQGTKIDRVSADMRRMEAKLSADERVEAVSAFIGMGPPRFYLPVEPEQAYSCYGQLIVNVRSLDELNELVDEMDAWGRENVPEALVLVRRFGLGPSKTWKVEARISGPALADLSTLRKLGNEVLGMFESSPYCGAAQLNWRQPVERIRLEYDPERGRWSNVSRHNIAEATKRAYDGLPIGQFREKDKLLPILLRNEEDDRNALADKLAVLTVQPDFSERGVPLRQVIRDISVDWEEQLIWRWNRRRTVTVQANAKPGVTADALRESLIDQIDQFAKTLPPGYAVEWGGEYEDSRDAQRSLVPGIIPAGVIMALIVVGLFNAYRPALVIVFVVPFVAIGITVGLLVTGQPFGFVALLGAMSLSGMMIKNAIVLLDEINLELAAGRSRYDAVIQAAMSRLRPVALAAATTVLGVVPLLSDVFWVSMAVTIMFGLAFGTLLTMILLPILYTLLFRVKPE